VGRDVPLSRMHLNLLTPIVPPLLSNSSSAKGVVLGTPNVAGGLNLTTTGSVLVCSSLALGVPPAAATVTLSTSHPGFKSSATPLQPRLPSTFSM